MKKIGDKSSILSLITGFQTQNPFRKPLGSNPQEPTTTSNGSWIWLDFAGQLPYQITANCHIKNRPTVTSKFIELVDYQKKSRIFAAIN